MKRCAGRVAGEPGEDGAVNDTCPRCGAPCTVREDDGISQPHYIYSNAQVEALVEVLLAWWMDMTGEVIDGVYRRTAGDDHELKLTESALRTAGVIDAQGMPIVRSGKETPSAR